MKTVAELRKMRARALESMQALLTAADKRDDAGMTEAEETTYEELRAETERLDKDIERREFITGMLSAEPVAHTEQRMEGESRPQAPVVLKTGLGDSEARAMGHFLRSGDASGIQTRASNDSDMNVTTDADGGYGVPTGHYNGIIARRDEGMLAQMLGARNIPGKGTTVNVPLDGEADGEFVATNEAADHDRDAPALGTKALTLVRYTKKVQLSWELLEDEDSRLLAFLEDFVGRGIAKTHNSLLLTEVAANGTSFKTFASASAIAAGEPEDIVANDDLSAYLEDDRSISWVMRSSTHWDIKSLLGDARLYAGTEAGGKNLLGYPVAYSQKAAAVAASAKPVYFGNWNYVGYRDPSGITVLRDPYSYEAGIELRYQFRAVYGVLQAEAIGYGVHPSA